MKNAGFDWWMRGEGMGLTRILRGFEKWLDWAGPGWTGRRTFVVQRSCAGQNAAAGLRSELRLGGLVCDIAAVLLLRIIDPRAFGGKSFFTVFTRGGSLVKI